MKKTSPLLQKAQDYVFNLLREKLSPSLIYHNYLHTAEVVEAANEVSEGCNLSKEDSEVITLAAWFHDTGFVEKYDGHEEVSKEIAERFLKENFYPPEKIEIIKGCIEATKYPQKPNGILQSVLCDADLSGISRKNYFETAGFLRHELEMVRGEFISDMEWLKSEIDFLSQHKYHTPYAQTEFERKKNKHMVELQAMFRDWKEKEAKKEEKKVLKDKDEDRKKPDRGVETMFRTTIKNHMDLSAMADTKANIMISVNSIILGFTVSNVFSKFDQNTYLVLPTALLLLVCLLGIVFAILSTRPKVTSGMFSKEQITAKKANLLFFGNFYKMDEATFEWGINELMNDSEYLYNSMIRDLYNLGKVLGRKYRFLRIAYTIFMFGLIAAVLSYGVSYWYYYNYLGTTPVVTQ